MKKLNKRRRGRPPKSGVYSPVLRDEFLQEHPDVQRYIQAARDGLVQDQLAKMGAKSEDELPATILLSIDRLTSRIALSRQIEVCVRHYGILRRDSLDRKVLEAEPILLFWLQLQNSIDRASGMLGVEVPKPEEVWDIKAELAKLDEEAAKKKEANDEDRGKD